MGLWRFLPQAAYYHQDWQGMQSGEQACTGCAVMLYSCLRRCMTEMTLPTSMLHSVLAEAVAQYPLAAMCPNNRL
jgi:hypothetical protein